MMLFFFLFFNEEGNGLTKMCGSDKDGVSRHCFVYRLWVGEGGRGVIITLFKISPGILQKEKKIRR